MSRRLGIKAFMHGIEYVNISARKQPVSFASHRARIFCSGCNLHFKQLEDAAIPFVVPMAKGRSLVLGPDSQAVLALWATKTAIALIAATGPELRELVPVDHRDSVRRKGLPADESWVAFLPWEGALHVFAGDHQLVDHGVNPPPSYQTYAAVFTFAQLAFKVMGFIDPLGSSYVIDGDMPSIKQVWPKKVPFLGWPPVGPPATDGNIKGIVEFAPIIRRS